MLESIKDKVSRIKAIRAKNTEERENRGRGLRGRGYTRKIAADTKKKRKQRKESRRINRK